jgi:hypothetical protein
MKFKMMVEFLLASGVVKSKSLFEAAGEVINALRFLYVKMRIEALC